MTAKYGFNFIFIGGGSLAHKPLLLLLYPLSRQRLSLGSKKRGGSLSIGSGRIQHRHAHSSPPRTVPRLCHTPPSALARLCLTVPKPPIGSGTPLPHRPRPLPHRPTASHRLWHPSASPSQNPLSALASLCRTVPKPSIGSGRTVASLCRTSASPSSSSARTWAAAPTKLSLGPLVQFYHEIESGRINMVVQSPSPEFCCQIQFRNKIESAQSPALLVSPGKTL